MKRTTHAASRDSAHSTACRPHSKPASHAHLGRYPSMAMATTASPPWAKAVGDALVVLP